MTAQSLKLQPVAVNFTLKDHIHEVLRDAILQMDLYNPETDTRLDERKIAEQLGVSRTPVREALARLEQNGFVEILPRKGVFVRRQSLEEILDMIIAWAALESMAARRATEYATDEELATLRKLGTGDGADPSRADLSEYSEANIRFHQHILHISKCNLIKEMADGLFTHMYAVRRRTMTESDRAEHSVVDHMAIIEAIESRNADEASRLVREHTMRLHDHIQQTWREIEAN